MLIGECLPKNHKVPFETINRLLTKKEIGDVIDHRLSPHRPEGHGAVRRRDHGLGFRHAFKAGISVRQGRHDHPDREGDWSTRPSALVADYEQQYQDGLITQQEKYNKVIDAWSRCGDQVANAMMDEIKAVSRSTKTAARKRRSTRST